ncbi:MAG TPA: hypothetical protein PKA10_08955 [Selenomonadales bacterium]|nr:hypothetical protein [Selenomonadales bacterium]
MKRDGFIWSIHAGMLAALVYGIVDSILFGTGIHSTPIWRAAAGIFLEPAQIATRLGVIVGWIGHLAVGGLWGLVFYGVLTMSGSGHSNYKGILLGLFAWLVDSGLIRFGITTSDAAGPEGTLIALLLDSVVYGGLLGYLAPRLINLRPGGEDAAGWLAGRLAAPAGKPDQERKPDPEGGDSSRGN